MKIVHKGSKIFLRHWFKWYVIDEEDAPWEVIDNLLPLFEKPKILDEKQR